MYSSTSTSTHQVWLYDYIVPVQLVLRRDLSQSGLESIPSQQKKNRHQIIEKKDLKYARVTSCTMVK